MRKAALILLLACPAGAIQINGGDYHGSDLVPANNDILRGTFINVGNFNIAFGNTVLVGSGERLAVYAATVTIAGHLNASGSGLPGGAAGTLGLPGSDGFSPDAGAGSGGAATFGGGGGGHAGVGGQGEPAGSGGPGGFAYDLDADIGFPVSAADAFLGSGGGGGGGGNDQSGGGGSGGGAVYIEAGYVVVSGTISANGQVGGVGVITTVPPLSAGGGGGSGGSVLIKSAGQLNVSGGRILNSGGSGGDAISGGDSPNPGGGGAAGRVRLIYNSVNFSGVSISTAGGVGGDSDFGFGTTAQAGSAGTASFGLFPSSPAAFAVTGVFKSSAIYSWTGKADAQWGGPVSEGLNALTIKQFRLYASTTAVPFSSYYTGFYAADAVNVSTETGLTPNSNIGRMLTAYTDFGDSAPSAMISFKTQAAVPQGQGFASASAASVTFQWSSGTVAEGFNPAATIYEITSSSVPGFAAAVHTAETVGISSSPAGLAPNTTYYFKARAHGINGAFTGYTVDFATPTLALAPVLPSLDGVFVSSVQFSWSGAGNPPGTVFEAQVSEDSFQNVKASSLTLAVNAVFEGLSPGRVYSLRVRALNHAGRQTDFTLALSTTAGQLGNLEAPGRPEPPNPTTAFSYDGTAVFKWASPAGSVPIFEYVLEIGTILGGNIFIIDSSTSIASTSYSVSGLVSGKTYYARVHATSNAGVIGVTSLPGSGVAVWTPGAQPAVAKPYNWPNPFDPRKGATNIGFNLAAPARVTMTVYTLQGRRVREIAASEGSGGNKVWAWDGRNGEGRIVEPGGYLVLVKKDYGSRSEIQRCKIAVLY